jgi:hypothetical protein
LEEKRLILLIVLILLALPIYGQGSFLVESYSYQEYDGHRQNWSITQDTSGTLFFGNNNSLLWYDGVQWHNQHISNNSIIRSLYTTRSGETFYGTVADFGKLGVDSTGNLNYQSFVALLPDTIKFDEIFHIEEFDSHIYFQSSDYIFKFYDDQFSIIDNELEFSQLSKAGDHLFVRLKNDGLYEINNDSLEYVPNGKYFKERHFFSAEQLDDKFLLTTVYSGLALFDGTNIEPLDYPISDFLARSGLYRSERINSNHIAFATLSSGIVIANTDDWSYKVFDESDGLSNNQVYEIFLDSEGVLWAATDDGISKILVNQPIFTLNSLSGLSENIIQVHQHEDYVYVATTRQLSIWNTKDTKLIELSIRFPFSLSESNGRIFVSSRLGIYEVSGENITLIHDKDDLRNIRVVDLGATQKIVGVNEKGLFFIELNNNTTSITSTEIDTDKSLIDLEIYDHTIWGMSRRGDIFQFDLEGKEINRFDLNLGEGYMARSIGVYAGNITIGTDVGLFSIIEDKVQKREEINSLFELGENDAQQFFRFELCNEQLYVFYNRQIVRFDGEEVFDSPYQLIGEQEEINTIHCMNDHVWFGGNAGVYILEKINWDYENDFKTNITNVYLENDSLIYGGFGKQNGDIILPYDDNEFRFNYSAASYIDSERNSYAYMLEGFDSDWSKWTSETQKDYTSIPEGDYLFKVKSRNVHEVVGTTDTFALTILPPWYRTWWAYLLYLLLTSAILYIAYKIRVHQLLKVERIRTKIASDLHDEVSATLTGISYFAEAVKTNLDVGKKEHFMNLITESAGEAKDKISDIVWSISPENDDWVIFLSKCRRFASDLVESRALEYDFKIAEYINGQLDMNVRQHLWMIFKEMITNAVRHSNATRVDVIIDSEYGVFKMIVQDNGDGFDISSKVFGNGLNNIKRRAERIKAEVELDSELKIGTRWKLEVQL